MLAMYVMAFTSGGFLLYLYDYLVMKPAYLCQKEAGAPFESCTAQEICSTPNITWKVDWSNPMSLDNWVDQLDLMCNEARI